jgi:hypothetical protein
VNNFAEEQMNDDFFNPAFLLTVILINTLVGWAIGNWRGRAAFGLLVGFLLGPIGWIITLVLPQIGPQCPQCCGFINRGAIRCCHCGSEILPPRPSSIPSLRRR